MIGRQVIQTVRRLISPRLRRAQPPRSRPEFEQVNAVAGIEPLRPALSGLRIRHPSGAPQRMTHWPTDLEYRWQPSAEYRRRQQELREMNQWLKQQPGRLPTLPPILFYVEETDIAPTRLQPKLEEEKREESLPPVGELPHEEMSGLHPVWMIRPRLPNLDPEELLASRPLLPRHYRRFLRSSVYPKIIVGLAAVAASIFGVLWVTQLQQAEAVAAGRLHLARHAFQAELDAARAYGLEPSVLRPLELQAHRLEVLRAPEGLISRARLRFYRERARDYHVLLRRVRWLERRALHYWAWRASRAYAELVEATHLANSAGLSAKLSPIPACQTPRCYRAAVPAQTARAAWLRQTVATIGVYRAAVLQSPDPAAAAGGELQKARALHAILPPWAAPPARIPNLDGRYATASGPADYARVGALAHLDVDALQADLVRVLPGRAIVVSVEDQNVTLYQRQKAVYQSPATADATTPIGIFHIQAKQVAIPALYWNRSGIFYRYRYGSLPDWMPFSGQAALQAAPWRTVFGPGSDSVQPFYAPSTPGSVDLPPAAAGFLFGWVAVGTEVAVY